MKNERDDERLISTTQRQTRIRSNPFFTVHNHAQYGVCIHEKRRARRAREAEPKDNTIKPEQHWILPVQKLLSSLFSPTTVRSPSPTLRGAAEWKLHGGRKAAVETVKGRAFLGACWGSRKLAVSWGRIHVLSTVARYQSSQRWIQAWNA